MMELTDRKVAAIKPAKHRLEIKDGRYPLYLVIQPTGTKSFQWRGTTGGKERRVTIGRYGGTLGGGISLREARTEALRLRSANENSAQTDAPRAAPSPTVTECFHLYMEREGNKRASGVEKWRMWRNDIEPAIGDRRIDEVSRLDLATIISVKFEKILACGGVGTGSNRLHAHLSRFFVWSMKHGYAHTRLEANPMESVVKIADEHVGTRVLSEDELRWFFRSLKKMSSGRGNDESDEFGRGYELLLRLFARRSEVFESLWDWISGDKMLIPRTKNSDPQLIWLHPSALRLLGDKPTKSDGTRVFKISPTAMDKPTNRLRREMSKLAADEGKTIEHWTLRDLRRTATTTILGFLDEHDRQLVEPHIRDRLLNHRERGVIRHYDHHRYFAERKRALTIWNDYLDNLSKDIAE